MVMRGINTTSPWKRAEKRLFQQFILWENENNTYVQTDTF
jgi:hypothetical protein